MWGSEIGRLFLCHKLIASQFEAAKRWSRLGVEYRHSIGAPPPYEKPGTLGSVDIVGAVNGYSLGDDPPVDTTEGRALRERRLRYIGEMEAALAVLGAGWPRRCGWTVRAGQGAGRGCRPHEACSAASTCSAGSGVW